MKNGRNTLVGEVEIPSETQEFTLEKAAEILISDEEYLLFMASRGEFSIHGKSGKKMVSRRSLQRYLDENPDPNERALHYISWFGQTYQAEEYQ